MAYRVMKKGARAKKPVYQPFKDQVWSVDLGAGVHAERKANGDVILKGTASIVVMTKSEARRLYQKLSGDYKD